MGKSYKKFAYIKDKPRNKKRTTLYWKLIRRVWKQEIHNNEEPRLAKSIINDYDYCDYKWLPKKEEIEKYKRK